MKDFLKTDILFFLLNIDYKIISKAFEQGIKMSLQF